MIGIPFAPICRRSLITFFAAALAVAAALPAWSRPLDEIRADGTLVVAVYRDFPPFSYARGNDLAGADVDLGRALAAALGTGIRFMAIAAGETMDDDLRNAVWKGHYIDRRVADVMLRVPIDRQFARRNPQIAFFAPYNRQEFVLAQAPGSEPLDGDLQYIDGVRIGVELHAAPDFFLTSIRGGALIGNVVHFPTLAQSTAALKRGDVGAVLGARNEIEAGLGAVAPAYRFTPVSFGGFAKASWVVGVAVDEHSRDLGYALEDIIAGLIASGRLKEIYAGHGLAYAPPE